MQRLALAAIRFYQRHLSPRKGFCCAYRAHTGRASCSTLGYRAIRRFGVFSGLRLLRQRLGKCGIAHRRYSLRSPAWQGQAGFCDIPCDLPCDLSCDFDPTGTACDILSNCSPCDCGDWRWRRDSAEAEQQVHIPPHSRFEARRD